MTAVLPAISHIPMPTFARDLETAFQQQYYAEIRVVLRYAALLLALLFLAYAARDYFDTHDLAHAFRANGAPALFYLCLFGLTFWGSFPCCWQPVILVGGLVMAAVSLGGLSVQLANRPPVAMGPFRAQHLFYASLVTNLMVCAAVLRLQFKWALALEGGLLAIAILAFLPFLGRQETDPSAALARLLQPVLLILVAVLLAAYVQENLARTAFLANHLLDEERHGERRQRLETEGKLNVLSQAIGGIVHDLGNPLAAVQMGVGTLEEFLADGETDRETLLEFSTAINHGAQMLNCLRLSLMEQTRVLDGKPTPVDLRPVALRQVVEAGMQYQKSNYSSGRTLSLVGEDIELYADVMKLTTVFMNLIGNALKYSDGEVRVTWRRVNHTLLVAVLDQGFHGQGLTECQARQLFVPFGRLDAHAKVEGTGLGLLSARKVVEAHGGEIFIEGYPEGTPSSAPFTTATLAATGTISMLEERFCTAFVIAGLPFTAVGEAD